MSHNLKPKEPTEGGIPPKSPVNRGIMSTGSNIPVTSYPGGEKTFLGCFQRVKIEGRRGRGYWEWKAAEMRKSKSGHEGDDERTSGESDTIARRSANLKNHSSSVTKSQTFPTFSPETRNEKKLGSPIEGGVQVLPPYVPYVKVTPNSLPHQKSQNNQFSFKQTPSKDDKEQEENSTILQRITIKSYDKPHLTSLHKQPSPPKSPSSSFPPLSEGNIPSAPPKELVYADAESKREGRSLLAEGHSIQSVGYSDPSKYYRENKNKQDEKIVLKSDDYNKRNLNSACERKGDNKSIKYYPKDAPPLQKEKYETKKKSAYTPPVKVPQEFVSNYKTQLPKQYPANNLNSCQNDNTLSSINSFDSRNYSDFDLETKPLLCEDSKASEREPTNKALCAEESRSTAAVAQLSEYEEDSKEDASLVLRRQNLSPGSAKKSERRSGALVWVSQPGGGAKLEWVPTPGLATLRAVPATPPTYGRGRVTQSQIRAGSQRNVVAGQKSSAEESTIKGIIKRGDEGGGGGGRERGRGIDASGVEARAGESFVARASSVDPRVDRDGNASLEGGKFVSGQSFQSNQNKSHENDNRPGVLKSSFESGNPKNVYSSAPGLTRPEGRTDHQTGIVDEKSNEGVINKGEEDKIVTVAGKTHGQTVRIRVRPEVHAYLSNLPVIRGSLGPPHSSGITERRDSIRSANSSSASGLTVGSGEGSIGYQEQDYEAVVDEYTLLKKAVDDHDPEALRLLTATEAALNPEGGGGGSEYPYLREMKERLLIAKDAPLNTVEDPTQMDPENQLLEVHQTPVGTVVKLNADGYGSHTSPTHRVESFYTGTLESRKTHVHEFPKNAKTSSFITLSMLYATLLVVVCLGFVLSEVLTHNVPLYYYEAFFTYLYGISILFLLYVFCYLLSGSTRELPSKNQKVRKPEVLPTDGSPTQEKLTTPAPKPKKQKTSDNDHSHGSFFLRIGAIAFGLGTMIYNGLEFGVFFEIPMTSPCYQILRGVNPLLQLIFTFMQMYFIFMNARLNIHKFKFLARFGLMHIVATNICVWVRTLVRESLKEINEFRVTQGQTGEDYMIMEGIRRALENRGLLAPNRYMYNLDAYNEVQDAKDENSTISQQGETLSENYEAMEEDLVNRTCGRMEIMGSIVSDSAPYLYPFIIEYSLIGASVVYIMWKHIGRNPKYVYDAEAADGMSVVSRRCHSKVDCIGASKGLFCGLLVLVATLICLILFFVLIHREELRMLAIYLADVSHCGIMLISIIGIFIGFCRVRHLKFFGEREEELDDILLMVSAFGLFAYAIFSAVAGSLSAFTEEPNLLVMVTGILSVIQVMIQIVFIKDTQRRQVALPEQERTKPGRQIVTFLLICNLAMFIIYTFETQKVEANPVQLEFFGKLSWTILLRCTIPLAIFHRFHSSVVLAAIWKNSYKTRLE